MTCAISNSHFTYKMPCLMLQHATFLYATHHILQNNTPHFTRQNIAFEENFTL